MKVTAMHLFCSGDITVVRDALVLIIQTSLAVETAAVGVMEDAPPQTLHHTYTVKEKQSVLY